MKFIDESAKHHRNKQTAQGQKLRDENLSEHHHTVLYLLPSHCLAFPSLYPAIQWPSHLAIQGPLPLPHIPSLHRSFALKVSILCAFSMPLFQVMHFRKAVREGESSWLLTLVLRVALSQHDDPRSVPQLCEGRSWMASVHSDVIRLWVTD